MLRGTTYCYHSEHQPSIGLRGWLKKLKKTEATSQIHSNEGILTATLCDLSVGYLWKKVERAKRRLKFDDLDKQYRFMIRMRTADWHRPCILLID